MKFSLQSQIKFQLYHKFYVPYLVHKMRRKKCIKVVFIVNYISCWKTEGLFNEMLRNERFNSIICITKNIEVEHGEIEVIEYCKRKGYEYIICPDDTTIVSCCNPDVIFYEKPYEYYMLPKHRVDANMKTLLAYVDYGFHSVLEDWVFDNPIKYYAFQHYYENSYTLKEEAKYMRTKGSNMVATGTPLMDKFLEPCSNYSNPWKDDSRKKIIWAPHHSIGDNHSEGIAYSTFLDNCQLMLQLTETYADRIQMAFKPHPLLYTKLVALWGKERTDAYYMTWDKGENTMLQTGQYIGLFKYSDAMIHDCASFTIEYHYTGNPVMYLGDDVHHCDNLNQFVTDAYNLHYKGRTKEDIETFIENVVRGYDPMKEQRRKYVKASLIPPYGRTASENIINAILGQKEFA